MTERLLTEIRDLLKSIDARLAPPRIKPSRQVKLGRVYSNGQQIPDEVDLVMAAGGLRWVREQDPAGAPTGRWYPRDAEGPVLSSNELLSRTGHVTEIPPSSQETP